MKRSHSQDDSESSKSSSASAGSENEEISDEPENLDVDFEFKSASEIDFHGLKTLLAQIFQQDLDKIDGSKLADLIIATDWTTVVKVDDGLDPFYVSTILDSDSTNETVQDVIKLLKSKSSDSKYTAIWSKHVGIVLNDRLINMPPQLAPPILKMLLEDVQYKVEDGMAPFDYLVFISKIYKEVAAAEEDEVSHKKKRQNKTKKPENEVFYFQAEDEFIEKECFVSVDYHLPQKQVSDSRRAFSEMGIDPLRRIIVVEYCKMDKILKTLQENLIE
jgi:protein BCP1